MTVSTFTFRLLHSWHPRRDFLWARREGILYGDLRNNDLGGLLNLSTGTGNPGSVLSQTSTKSRATERKRFVSMVSPEILNCFGRIWTDG